MANNCTTDYYLIGSKQNVEAACAALQALLQIDRPFVRNSYESDNNWCGYIATDILGNAWEDVCCRGLFYDPDVVELAGGYACSVTTDTAWSPCTELWQMFAKKFNLSLNWYASEPGSLYYEKVNPDNVFPFDIYYNDDDGEELFDSVEEFIASLGDQYGLKPGMDFETVRSIVSANDDCIFTRIKDSTHVINDDDNATTTTD